MKTKQTTTAPDMTREQIKELKQLDARDRKLTRKILLNDRAAWQVGKRLYRDRKRVNRKLEAECLQRHGALQKEARKETRSLAAARKAIARELAAIDKRRDILTGRIAS